MRILILSDSHGAYQKMLEAVLLHEKANTIVFLGDGRADIERIEKAFPKKEILSVSGNCDFGWQVPKSRVEIVAGKRILCTHGDAERVKHGLLTLEYAGKDAGVDIVLYGHTHIQKNEKIGDIRFINPGSLLDGKYAFIDIIQGNVAVSLCKLLYGSR